jgi:hypothetical protein
MVSQVSKVQFGKATVLLGKAGVPKPQSSWLPAYANLVAMTIAPSTASEATKVAQQYASTIHNTEIGKSANIHPAGMSGQHESVEGCRCVYCYWNKPKRNFSEGSFIGRFGKGVQLKCTVHGNVVTGTQRPSKCELSCAYGVWVVESKQYAHTLLAEGQAQRPTKAQARAKAQDKAQPEEAPIDSSLPS